MCSHSPCVRHQRTKMLLVTSLVLALSTLVDLTKASTPHVLDIAGRPVQAGKGYYMLPVNDTQFGGLTGISEYGSCPFNVMLSASRFSNGSLLSIHPVTGKGTVRLGIDLNMQFFLVTLCVDLSVWKLAKFDKETNHRFVTLGGLVGHPGADTVDNWFKIEKEGDHYKLVFCPTVCDSCSVVCGNLGTYTMDGRRLLALGDPALAVKFVRDSRSLSIRRPINSRR
ncbi:kunitz trypsin inhibitor 5-like isoform X2 [Nymphaea colorata]|uniref:kunitz trypsin inhibitor 5-like isoform X2 n=1 Tax=Nymphaea colorata TaxID=210225 RepID=UPI00129D2CD8|nr:kunitz trypsin inhibitor 5-like isoform X2 [Nymphaea colorata]